jgi:hypothetical protein
VPVQSRLTQPKYKGSYMRFSIRKYYKKQDGAYTKKYNCVYSSNLYKIDPIHYLHVGDYPVCKFSVYFFDTKKEHDLDKSFIEALLEDEKSEKIKNKNAYINIIKNKMLELQKQYDTLKDNVLYHKLVKKPELEKQFLQLHQKYVDKNSQSFCTNHVSIQKLMKWVTNAING